MPCIGNAYAIVIIVNVIESILSLNKQWCNLIFSYTI